MPHLGIKLAIMALSLSTFSIYAPGCLAHDGSPNCTGQAGIEGIHRVEPNDRDERFVVVVCDDTWSSLAKRYFNEPRLAKRLAEANDMDPNVAPPVGSQIRIPSAKSMGIIGRRVEPI